MNQKVIYVGIDVDAKHPFQALRPVTILQSRLLLSRSMGHKSRRGWISPSTKSCL